MYVPWLSQRHRYSRVQRQVRDAINLEPGRLAERNGDVVVDDVRGEVVIVPSECCEGGAKSWANPSAAWWRAVPESVTGEPVEHLEPIPDPQFFFGQEVRLRPRSQLGLAQSNPLKEKCPLCGDFFPRTFAYCRAAHDDLLTPVCLHRRG